tara:strand:- start:167 stop:1336 length:1170 start_codon:yes stop_codon:yes gene_type:complete
MGLFVTLEDKINAELERREEEKLRKEAEELVKQNEIAEEKKIAAVEKKAREKIKRKRLEKYGLKKQGGVLRYPAEALTEHTDYLQIDIERYEAIGDNYITSTGSSNRYVIGTAKQNQAGKTPSKKLAKKPLINLGSILLPIPSNIEDSNNVVYGDSSLNGLAAAGVSAVETGMTTLGQAIAGTGKVDLAAIKSDISNKIEAGLGGGDKETALATAGDIVTKKLISEAVNIFGQNVTTQQLLSRNTGEILNPNMELLFSDVTVRNFRFNFKLTPRNPKEAEQVKLIIRAFKRNMAPQAQGGVQGAGNFFLRTPNVFKIRYRSGNKDHPFLNKFKQCFLTGVQTTYTGEGVYSTYDDRTPVSILLDLSFKEIQPIYDIDYDSRPGTGAVGY